MTLEMWLQDLDEAVDWLYESVSQGSPEAIAFHANIVENIVAGIKGTI